MSALRLFAKLYLDEDVDVLVADLVRVQGFVVTTVRKENMLSRSDEEQLSFAAAHAWVVITHNRADFEELATRCFEEGRACRYRLCIPPAPARNRRSLNPSG